MILTFSYFTSQAIEDGNLDEIEELSKSQKRKKRKAEEQRDDTPKAKKKRGRPPVGKPKPNHPRMTKMMKKLYELVVNYKDRSASAELIRLALNCAVTFCGYRGRLETGRAGTFLQFCRRRKHVTSRRNYGITTVAME